MFVTNFPEKMDDAAIRHLFSQVNRNISHRAWKHRLCLWNGFPLQYGEMMDPRWPSRKYKDSRRFCYVQFLTTASTSIRTHRDPLPFPTAEIRFTGLCTCGLRAERAGTGARTRYFRSHIRPGEEKAEKRCQLGSARTLHYRPVQVRGRKGFTAAVRRCRLIP